MIRSEGVGALELQVGDVNGLLLVGSAARQDGRSASLTAPNGSAQRALIVVARGVTEVGSVEAHGTGTGLGDPTEMGALAAVQGMADRGENVAIGAVKASVGHSEPASGLVSLLRVQQQVAERSTMLGNAKLQVLNPLVHNQLMYSRALLLLPMQEATASRLTCGVSSFGFSGMIAHALLRHHTLDGVGPASVPRLAYRRGRFSMTDSRASPGLCRTATGSAISSRMSIAHVMGAEQVSDFVAQAAGVVVASETLSLDEPLVEAGMDSLGFTELATELRKGSNGSLSFAPVTLQNLKTLRSISLHIQSAVSEDVSSGRSGGTSESLLGTHTGSDLVSIEYVEHALEVLGAERLTSIAYGNIQGMSELFAGLPDSPRSSHTCLTQVKLACEGLHGYQSRPISPLVLTYGVDGESDAYDRLIYGSLRALEVWRLRHTWLVNGVFAIEPSSSLLELTEQNAHLLAHQLGSDRIFDLIGLSLGGLLAHMTANAAQRLGANPRFLILVDPNPPAPCPGVPPQTMAELGYYTFWHLVHQAGLDFLPEEAPEKVALSLAHLHDDEISAFVVQRHFAVAAHAGTHLDQKQIIDIQRQIRVKQKMNHLLYHFGVHNKEKLPVHTPRSGEPGVVLYLGLTRRLWFGRADFEARSTELRALHDYGATAAVLQCGDRDHVGQCAMAASDRLPLWSSLLVEVLIGGNAQPSLVIDESDSDAEELSAPQDYSLAGRESAAAHELFVQLLYGDIRAVDSSSEQTLGHLRHLLAYDGPLELQDGEPRLVPPCAPGHVALDDGHLLCNLAQPGITEARLKKPHLAHFYQVVRETMGAHVLVCADGGEQRWLRCSVDVGHMFLQIVCDDTPQRQRITEQRIGVCVLLFKAGSDDCHKLETGFAVQARARTDVLALKIQVDHPGTGGREHRLMGWPNRLSEPFQPALLAFGMSGHQVGALGGAAALESASMLTMWWRDVWKS
jgi:hypothetical protein